MGATPTAAVGVRAEVQPAHEAWDGAPKAKFKIERPLAPLQSNPIAMPLPTDLNLDAIRAPLPGDSPVGVNLRADTSFQSPLRNLRDRAREARSKERDARDGKAADVNPAAAGLEEWQSVRQDGWGVLCGTSKDLDVAVLFIEALTRTDGIGGLTFGFQACAALIDDFWESILQRSRIPLDAEEGAEPPSTEDAIESQLRLLSQLNENDLLALPIGYATISQGAEAALAFWQYQQAVEAEKKSAEERERSKVATLSDFRKSVAETPVDFFVGLLDDLSQAKSAVLELEAVLARKLGEHIAYAPSFTQVVSALENVESSIHHLAKDKLPKGGPGVGPGKKGSVGGGEFAVGEPSDRDQAFQQLLSIADFFAKTEPLSLLAEQIRQVVHRARLRPEEYYSELIESPEALERFFKTVGIRPRAQESPPSESEST